MCSYSVEYTEDSAPVTLFPLNTTEFFISDQDNVFLLQSILTVQDAGKETSPVVHAESPYNQMSA